MPLVFHPYQPVVDASELICGTAMIIAAAIVIRKVMIGSKNQFALVLLSLTIVIGFSYIGWACTDCFKVEVQLPDRKNYNYSAYAFQTFLYLSSTFLRCRRGSLRCGT